jgi:hypothetical protein
LPEQKAEFLLTLPPADISGLLLVTWGAMWIVARDWVARWIVACEWGAMWIVACEWGAMWIVARDWGAMWIVACEWGAMWIVARNWGAMWIVARNWGAMWIVARNWGAMWIVARNWGARQIINLLREYAVLDALVGGNCGTFLQIPNETWTLFWFISSYLLSFSMGENFNFTQQPGWWWRAAWTFRLRFLCFSLRWKFAWLNICFACYNARITTLMTASFLQCGSLCPCSMKRLGAGVLERTSTKFYSY